MNFRTVAAVALIAVGLLGLPSLPDVQPSVSVSEPSEDMKTAVKSVVKVAAKMSPIDRLWLQNIYENFAKVVSADGIVEEPTITSTDSLRAVHVAVLKFIWRGMADNSPSKYEGLAEAIDDAMNSAISDDSRPLTPEMRTKAAELCKAIAWAGLGKDQ